MEENDGLIGEFVLIDDCSQATYNDLFEFWTLLKIAVVYKRNPVRRGLIQARNIGATIASQQILLFTDSHIIMGRVLNSLSGFRRGKCDFYNFFSIKIEI